MWLSKLCSNLAGVPVVLAAFFIQLLTFGTVFSVGVYTLDVKEYFNTSGFIGSVIGSVSICTFFSAGPITSCLLTRISHKNVALLGALLANIGYIALPFTPNLPYLVFFYSIMAALGSNMAFMSSTILCGLTFKNNQNSVSSIIKMGSGVGTTVMPIVINRLIEDYGWKHSFYILCGLNLHLVPLGLLLTTRNTLKTENGNDVAKGNNQEIMSNGHQHLSADEQSPSTKTKLPICCFSELLQIELLSNLNFILYLFTIIFWNISSSGFVVFLPDIAHSFGLDKGKGSLCVTIYSVGALVGTMLNAIIGSILNRYCVYTVALALGGVVCFLISVSIFQVFVGFLCLCFMFGLAIGVIFSLMLVLTTDILSINHMSHGFGLIILSNGIGALIGPPFVGAVYDKTGSFTVSLYAIGGIMIAAVPLNCLVHWRKSNEKETTIHVPEYDLQDTQNAV